MNGFLVTLQTPEQKAHKNILHSNPNLVSITFSLAALLEISQGIVKHINENPKVLLKDFFFSKYFYDSEIKHEHAVAIILSSGLGQ